MLLEKHTYPEKQRYKKFGDYIAVVQNEDY